MAELNELMDQLLSKTEFEIMTDSKVLTSRKKISTPIESLNCLLGGGFPLGIIAHVWGEPRAGKSTILYQTMGIFQKEYPDGISVIIDMESSADPNRLKVLGVDVTRVVRLPATSIESGFISLKKLLQNKEKTEALKKVPIFVIWDTISKGLATDSTIQSRMAAMDRARVIKGYMSELQKSIEKHDFFLGLLNQVINTTDRYGNVKQSAGGGIALKHDNQISLHVSLVSDDYDEYGMLIARNANAAIDKSKISPEVKSLPYIMDVTSGAFIDKKRSLVSYLYNVGMIDPGAGGWYKLNKTSNHQFMDELGKKIIEERYDVNKSLRWNDLVNVFINDDVMFELGKHMIMNMIESKYSLQKEVISDYHQKCINRIKVLSLSLDDNEEEENSKESEMNNDV